ncbi:chaperone modulator CbpM [Flavihumibacter sp. CACIAM 22H1]|uniref:chaperone modulator CbpM n=1 Tax=Flavihumibacter sp. CACIAM 22H1 TaxID=1812911 RepID=UPI0007A89B35|nr:chaperone modulator CbpM [Flavihumibacter sp. CACIAM 22H1]KYP15212.1 MAG: hypothetical protein A1D16_03100 [Flavihumibacter sp. CACIAM 22H1]
MEQINKISLPECCTYYNIEAGFLQQLGDHGLLQFFSYEEESYLTHDQLADLEKYIHFYYELNINMEGMEAIKHLLGRILQLQQELKQYRAQQVYAGE